MNKTQISRKQLYIFIFSFLLCKFLYDYMILNFLPAQYMEGVTYGVHFNICKAIAGNVIYVLVGLITCVFYDENDMLSFLTSVLFFLYYLPLNSSFYLNDGNLTYFFLTNVFWTLIVVITRATAYRRSRKANNLTLETKVDASYVFLLFTVLFSLGILYFAYKYNGLALYIGLGDIYGARAEYVGSTKIIDSFFFNFGSFLVPIAILYSLKRRNYIFTVYMIFIQLVLFSIAREKGKLLVTVLIFAVFIASKLKLIKTIKTYFPAFFLAIMLVPIIEKLLFGSDRVFYLFIRRLMYYPAWLSKLYYDFFSTHDLLYWTQDVFLMERLHLNVYDVSCLTLINEAYFKGLVPSPNAGLFAEAYMHFGFLGGILYPLLIVIHLRVLLNSIKCFSEDIQVLIVAQLCLTLISIPITSGTYFIQYFVFVPVNWLLIQFVKNVKLNIRIFNKKKIYRSLYS